MFIPPFVLHHFIVIRNGKIVRKHGPYCWYFRLNLKYLGWPHRAYIKTAKNGNFSEELLSENDFEMFSPLSVVMTMVSRLLRQFRRSLQIKKCITNAPCVLYNLLNSQTIPKWKMVGYKDTSDVAKKALKVAQKKEQ